MKHLELKQNILITRPIKYVEDFHVEMGRGLYWLAATCLFFHYERKQDFIAAYC